LYLPLKPAKCVFEGLPLLKSYFSQGDAPPYLPGRDLLVMASLTLISQGEL
jgi:hypothetical protein